MKIEFDSGENLPLNKTIETSIVTIVVRAVFSIKITNILHKFF